MFLPLAEIEFYPVNDFGPVMKGLLIGGLGIVHVFLAQFAVGGGMVLTYFEWLRQSGREPVARPFVAGFFKYLVMISFVLGALTGVGLWFVTIQVSPQTIGTMVGEFHWIWAVEWVFFTIEIVAGYIFFRYAARLTDRTRMRMLLTYSIASWMSLFWINGILSWQLTPGGWLEGGNVWAGFFNPTFWPSLGYRTVASVTIAALVACLVINLMKRTRQEKERLVQRAAVPMLSILLMPLLGLWFVAAMPADSRSWILGGSPAMTMFMTAAVGASALLGAYAVIGLWRQRLFINGATASLLLALAFGATAGGEFVREGSRKPFTIREYIYSNAIRPEDVASLRETGIASKDPFPLRDAEAYPTEQLALGAIVFRAQCSVCHTMSGVNGLTHLAGTWTVDLRRQNIARMQRLKPFMPPFAGTPEELEAICQLIGWENAGRPSSWLTTGEPELYRRLRAYLDDAGTERVTPADAVRSDLGAGQ
jgi:hypothetical protein